jgi:lipopolysaccharide export system protein LptA
MVTRLLKAQVRIFLLAALLLWPASGFGAKAPAPGQGTGAAPEGKPAAAAKEKETPLAITAARLEADQDQHLIIFSGEVKAVYGNVTLYADQLLVYYKPTALPKESPRKPAATGEKPAAPLAKVDTSPLTDLGGEKIDRIVAKGHVRLVQEDKVAIGEEGVYYREKEMVELKGKPQVWRGENNLKGDKILYYLKTKRVLVESSPRQRVEAHLYQAEGKGPGMKELFPGPGPKPAQKPKP